MENLILNAQWYMKQHQEFTKRIAGGSKLGKRDTQRHLLMKTVAGILCERIAATIIS